MNTEVTAIIATLIGGIIGSILSYFATKTETGSDERTAFQESILKRIDSLETKQSKLEEQISAWRARYWALYSWLAQISREKLDIEPPEFHTKGVDELEECLRESIETHTRSRS
ncbi:hypothetical protein [Rhodohalobacter barkolensis]|uniref:Uncharacterized protein n=1 Tax=Rhodohalobacter barkolensis TaxID=2053187 RepID=A0A2N0VHT3_9BACT|nr:hypothetical protein [Rhodohalobacter barkolensis]PKD43747.1 hypothetical protein CWD77_09315 [Rhodohalobacter barkolensis]